LLGYPAFDDTDMPQLLETVNGIAGFYLVKTDKRLNIRFLKKTKQKNKRVLL